MPIFFYSLPETDYFDYNKPQAAFKLYFIVIHFIHTRTNLHIYTFPQNFHFFDTFFFLFCKGKLLQTHLCVSLFRLCFVLIDKLNIKLASFKMDN